MATYLQRPVFPLVLNLEAGEGRWLYDDSEVTAGFNGPATLAAQTHAKRRVSMRSTLLAAAHVAEVESWLASISMEARSAWFPCDLGEAVIVALEDAGDHTVRITGQDWATALPLAAGTVLRFFSPEGVASYATVTAAEAAGDDEIITLAEEPPAGFGFRWHVSRMILARVIEPRWSHQTEGRSTLDIAAVELPLEYAAPDAADDAVTTAAWLYTITRYTTPIDIVAWRVTSAPLPIIHAGKTYQPAQIDHDGLSTGTEGDADECKLRLGVWPDNPFLAWLPRHASGSYGILIDRVTIDPATGASLGAAVRWFRGEVEAVGRKGALITASCKSPLALTNARAPAFMIQTYCNYALYDANTCGVDPAAWQLTGTVEAVDEDGASVDFECADITGKAANWLVRGYVTITVAGETETRFVRSTTALSDTRHRLHLNMPTTLAVVGAAALAWPGCDKTFTGTAGCPRFANQARFGGHPFLPKSNPTIAAVQAVATGGGGKK